MFPNSTGPTKPQAVVPYSAMAPIVTVRCPMVQQGMSVYLWSAPRAGSGFLTILAKFSLN